MKAEIFVGLNRNDQLVYSPTGAIKCDKPDCYFCYLMIGDKSKIKKAPKYKQPKIPSLKSWSNIEDKLLLENIHNYDFKLPKRTRGAIKQRRRYLRNLNGIKPLRYW